MRLWEEEQRQRHEAMKRLRKRKGRKKVAEKDRYQERDEEIEGGRERG